MEKELLLLVLLLAVFFGYLSHVDLRLLDEFSPPPPSQSKVTAFYDRFGPLLMNDFYHQAFEVSAMETMLSICDISSGDTVVEVGPGTGYLAEKILSRMTTKTIRDSDSKSGRYIGIEVSSSMHETSKQTLQSYLTTSSEVEVLLNLVTNSTSAIADIAYPVDKVVLTYVMDLLPEEDLHQLVSVLHSKLRDAESSKICVVNLTYGVDALSRLVTNIWQLAYVILGGDMVGGCRPLQIERYFNRERGFEVKEVKHVVSTGLPSEVAIIYKA